MRRSIVERLRCPACGGRLQSHGLSGASDVESGSLRCDEGHSFAIEHGIPSLVHPEELKPSDAEFQRKYDEGAESYDANLAWLFQAFSVDEDDVRRGMVDLLDLRLGARVLDVGCGTAKDSAIMLERIGPTGELFAQDLSFGMLRVAQRKLEGAHEQVHLFQTNASYLPFGDGEFDAAFHF